MSGEVTSTSPEAGETEVPSDTDYEAWRERMRGVLDAMAPFPSREPVETYFNEDGSLSEAGFAAWEQRMQIIRADQGFSLGLSDSGDQIGAFLLWRENMRTAAFEQQVGS